MYADIKSIRLATPLQRAQLADELEGFRLQCDEDLTGDPRGVFDLADTSPEAVEWRKGRAAWKVQLGQTLAWLGAATEGRAYPLTIDLADAPEGVRADIAEACDNHPDLDVATYAEASA